MSRPPIELDRLDNFRRAAASAALPTDVRYVERGETYRFEVGRTPEPGT